jgi:hypothetical protein
VAEVLAVKAAAAAKPAATEQKAQASKRAADLSQDRSRLFGFAARHERERVLDAPGWRRVATFGTEH